MPTPVFAMPIVHRYTSQDGCSPKTQAAIIFRAKAKFFVQKPTAKNENRNIYLYLLNEKNGIHSV